MNCYMTEDDDYYMLYVKQFEFILGKLFALQNTFLSVSLIYSKSSLDILQGISKVDYLLKVSIFQIDKGKAPYQREESAIYTDDGGSTFVRGTTSLNYIE